MDKDQKNICFYFHIHLLQRATEKKRDTGWKKKYVWIIKPLQNPYVKTWAITLGLEFDVLAFLQPLLGL